MAEQAPTPVVNGTPAVPQTPAPADPTPAETPKPEVVAEPPVDTGERSAEDIKPKEDPKVDPPKAGDPKPANDPNKPETQPQGKAEQRIQQLESEIEDGKKKLGIDPNTQIRDLVSARSAIREQVQIKNAEVYVAATPEELLDQVNPETNELYTPLEAKVASMSQKSELDTYNNQVADKQLTLQSEATQALQEFGMFDPDNEEEYNPEIAKEVDKILFDSLVFDPNTKQVIDTHLSPYRLYKTVNDAVKAGIEKGQLAGQKATEQMMASADNSGGAQGGNPSFDSMSLTEKAAYLRKKGHDV